MTAPAVDLAAGYYGQPRANLVANLPRPVGRVLDVGCGEGGAHEALRAAGATWISGIEIAPLPAAVAAGRYDEVAVGDALAVLDQVQPPFDTILCHDVLEHLVDPADLVRRLLTVARAGATLQVSTPNARHVSLLRDLVLRGTFGYAPWGHRDRTHLRWFTRRDLVALLERAGWVVTATTPSAEHRLRELGVPAPRRLVQGLPAEFLAVQWYVVARASASS